MVVAVLVVLGAGEVAAGWFGPRMRDASLFHSLEADLKLGQMDALAGDGGAPLVFVGSSLIGVGVDPTLVADTVGVESYNAALASARPSLLVPWVRDVVFPRLSPEVVAIGVTSFDFFDADETQVDTFLDSRGYRMVTGTESIMDEVDRWLYQRSELWQHRADLKDPYNVLKALLGGTVNNGDWRRITESDGHLDLASVVEGFADISGPDLGEWELGVEAPAMVRALVEIVRDHGARPVLVNMPLTENYIETHPDGEADYEAYEEALRRLAEDTGVPLLFYDDRDVELFSDRVHLGDVGAQAFSVQLAHDLERLGILSGEWSPSGGFGDPYPDEPTPPLRIGRPDDG